LLVGLAPLHAALTRVVLVARPLPEVLDEIVTAAREALPGSEATSITRSLTRFSGHVRCGDHAAVRAPV